MRNRIYLEPATLSVSDRDEIRKALNNSKYASIAERLFENQNAPIPANSLMPFELVNQGDQNVNARLKKYSSTFRLVRIGNWAHPKNKDRLKRLLAFVKIEEAARI